MLCHPLSTYTPQHVHSSTRALLNTCTSPLRALIYTCTLLYVHSSTRTLNTCIPQHVHFASASCLHFIIVRRKTQHSLFHNIFFSISSSNVDIFNLLSLFCDQSLKLFYIKNVDIYKWKAAQKIYFTIWCRGRRRLVVVCAAGVGRPGGGGAFVTTPQPHFFMQWMTYYHHYKFIEIM